MNKRFCDTFDLRYIHISTYYVYLCIISNRDITILLYNISIYKPDKPRAKLYTYYSSVFINDNCNALRFTQHKNRTEHDLHEILHTPTDRHGLWTTFDSYMMKELIIY